MAKRIHIILATIGCLAFYSASLAQNNTQAQQPPAGAEINETSSAMPQVQAARGYPPPAGTVSGDSAKILKDAYFLTEQMTKQLNLTPAQVAKVKQINTTYQVQLTRAIVYEEGKPAGTTDSNRAKKIEATRLKSLEEVLSREQMNLLSNSK